MPVRLAAIVGSVCAVAGLAHVAYTSNSSRAGGSQLTEGNWRGSGNTGVFSSSSSSSSIASDTEEDSSSTYMPSASTCGKGCSTSVTDDETTDDPALSCTETCVDSLDETEGTGKCSYYVEHWDSVYGVDSCMSLYCENCEMASSCDRACGICTPTCITDIDDLDSAAGIGAAGANKPDDDALAAIGMDVPTSVASMSCDDQQIVSTDDTTDFMITSSGHGVQVVSVEVCSEEDTTASDLEIKLYNGCPNKLCNAKHSRWAYSETAYTGETLSAEGGCAHMTVELDAEAGEGVYLTLKPSDTLSSRDVKVAVSCSVNGVGASADAEENETADVETANEDADATETETEADAESEATVDTESSADQTYTTLACGDKVVDSTHGHSNFYGLDGPDAPYLLSLQRAGEFAVTVCPKSRDDVAVALFYKDSDEVPRLTNKEPLASAADTTSCTTVTYASEDGANDYWLVVDGTGEGSFSVSASCVLAPTAAPTASLSVSVRAENSYAASTEIGRDYPWNADESVMIVEPHRSTNFFAELSREMDVAVADLVFDWEFNGVMHDSKSQHVSTTFAKTGDFDARVVISDGQGNELASTTLALKVRYVRREVRDLSTTDQLNFMNAVSTMYAKSTEEGQSLYGTSFKGMDHFSSRYATLSADEQCNKVSNGLGFLTNHAALVSEFEESMQTVQVGHGRTGSSESATL